MGDGMVLFVGSQGVSGALRLPMRSEAERLAAAAVLVWLLLGIAVISVSGLRQWPGAEPHAAFALADPVLPLAQLVGCAVAAAVSVTAGNLFARTRPKRSKTMHRNSPAIATITGQVTMR